MVHVRTANQVYQAYIAKFGTKSASVKVICPDGTEEWEYFSEEDLEGYWYSDPAGPHQLYPAAEDDLVRAAVEEVAARREQQRPDKK